MTDIEHSTTPSSNEEDEYDAIRHFIYNDLISRLLDSRLVDPRLTLIHDVAYYL